MTDKHEATTFARLSDGTLLQRQSDGSFRTTTSTTDRAALAALTDAEIESMASSDPDHPGLDDAFWQSASQPDPDADVISIKLDPDVLSFFRRDGRSFRAQIHAALRQYIQGRS